MEQSRDEMIENFQRHLRNGFVEVTFTKKDGSERILKGTCNLNLISPQYHPKTSESSAESTPTRKVSDAVINAFDIEKQEWRSIRKDSIIKFDPIYIKFDVCPYDATIPLQEYETNDVSGSCQKPPQGGVYGKA